MASDPDAGHSATGDSEPLLPGACSTFQRLGSVVELPLTSNTVSGEVCG